MKIYTIKNTKNFANRGIGLEDDINNTNLYYRETNKAIIYKKPTPIKIVKVDYNKLRLNTITEAYFEMPSTTDYNGIYKGKYIDFEAKEVQNKTSFSLGNIHKHQIKHLNDVKNHGGISFIIVRFKIKNATYLLECHKLNEFIENDKKKSIPIEYFIQNGYLIKEKYNPRLDYLKIIDYIMEETK